MSKFKESQNSDVKNLVEYVQYLENIIALMPGHVYWKNREGVLLGCNDEQAKDIGLKSRHEIEGLTAYDTLPYELADAIVRVDMEVMETGIAQTIEEVFPLSDGEQSIWLSKKTPLFDKNNNVVGILGISFDITEQKRTEHELQETHHRLEGMTMVSMSTAHELRTPLATINAGIGNIKSYLPHLINAYQQAKKASLPVHELKENRLNLLDDILEVMEIEVRASFTFIDMLLMNVNPALESAKEVISITKCINEALARYPFAEKENMLVQWDQKNDFLVWGNELLIIHILFNLLKNALYYIAKAGKGAIHIRLDKESTYNLLIFEDTGTGIAQDILPHVFDRFFTKTYHGAGIGLTFCRMVMESVGGTIVCDSIEGEYTRFTLRFPIHKD